MNLLKQLSFFVLMLFLVNCSSQQKEDDTKAKEEALKQKEQELLQKEKELADKEADFKEELNSKSNAELSAKLLELWFKHEGDAMFDEESKEKINLNGHAYGMFTQGLWAARGLGDYGLTNVIAEHTGMSEAYFVNALEEMSGVSPYQADFKYNEHYKGLNPQFVDWSVTNLIPKANTSLLGYKAQDFYDRVFKRMLRILTVSRVYLDKDVDIKAEAEEYRKNFVAKVRLSGENEGQVFYGNIYLEDYYGGILKRFNSGYADEMQPTQAIGFWLRRYIDGSDATCWKHLQTIMQDYDQEWFQQYKQADKVGAVTITDDDLLSMYACFFERPYEYMFEETEEADNSNKIEINGRYYGRYAAGIDGILTYGNLNECATRVISGQDGSARQGDVTGLNVAQFYEGEVILKDKREAGFQHFNPQFIEWAGKNMVPNNGDQILGYTYQELYDRVFQRFFRTMVASYQYLQKERNFQEEYQRYKDEMGNADFEALSYLDREYKNTLTEYEISCGGDAWTPQMAIGFWLRRGIDGTSDELWEALKKALQNYDGQWLASQLTP